MFTPCYLSLRPPPRALSWICRLAPAMFVPLLAAGILIGPAPVQDPRPEAAPGPSCQARLTEAEAALSRSVVSSDAP